MNDFQCLARFNRWANERIYGVVAGLSDADYRAERGAFFGSIHATLNHLLVGDRIWFGRITGEVPEGIRGLDQILHDDFESLRSARADMDETIIRIVDGLGEDGLDQTRTFILVVTGEENTMVARRMLLSVFNHQTHHRGQVHCMLTGAGASIPPLDIVFFLREVEQAGA